MHGIAAITGNMHRSLRYFVLLEHITSIYGRSLSPLSLPVPLFVKLSAEYYTDLKGAET